MVKARRNFHNWWLKQEVEGFEQIHPIQKVEEGARAYAMLRLVEGRGLIFEQGVSVEYL